MHRAVHAVHHGRSTDIARTSGTARPDKSRRETRLNHFQCQNCGAPLEPRTAGARVIECGQCSSVSILVDEVFQLAGESGVFHPGEGLISLGQPFLFGMRAFKPIGHCQFSYGKGMWDEFWCLDHKGRGVWCSVDEGDYALESRIEHPNGRYALGESTEIDGSTYRAVEKDVAHCTAFCGELPEVLELNEKHEYVVFAGHGRRMATLERWNGGHAWTCGDWFSAWDIETL